MLAGILVLYAVIIGFGDAAIGDPVRIALLGFLLWTSARLRTERQLRRWAVVVAILTLAATSWATAVGSPH